MVSVIVLEFGYVGVVVVIVIGLLCVGYYFMLEDKMSFMKFFVCVVVGIMLVKGVGVIMKNI